MQSLYGEEFDFFPRSYLMPEDKAALQKAMSKRNKTFIFKPQASEQGQGILLA